MNFYNENDPKAASWLRELIIAGEIPEGKVDDRNISEIKSSDLKGFHQCHFFAGIGGWPYALRIAAWPAKRPVWTASLPCQPFSTAGRSKGVEDERHLWPVFFDLVKVCRPNIIFGEQVARAIGFNWLDGISADLEGTNYAVGQAVLGAHSVGSPHKRQRLYWVGVSMDDAKRSGLEGFCGDVNGRNQSGRFAENPIRSTSEAGSTSSLAYTGYSKRCAEQGNALRECDSRAGESSAWSNYELVYCRDEKFRRIEAGTFPLAYGIPGRVGLLRGYGNAIVPQLAREFIQASFETIIEIKTEKEMTKSQIYEDALLRIIENYPELLPEDNRGCGNEDDIYISGVEIEHFRLAKIALEAIRLGKYL